MDGRRIAKHYSSICGDGTRTRQCFFLTRKGYVLTREGCFSTRDECCYEIRFDIAKRMESINKLQVNCGGLLVLVSEECFPCG